MSVSRDAVVWAFRFMLGRDPESEEVIVSHMTASNDTGLIERLLRSSEFKRSSRFKDYFRKESVASADSWRISSISPKTAEGLKTIPIDRLPKACFRNEKGAKIRGTIRYPEHEEGKLSNLNIGFHGGQDPLSLVDVEITLASIPNLFIDISHSGQRIRFGERCSGRWGIPPMGVTNASVGDDVTSNGMDVYLAGGSTLKVGNDCMFANGYIHVTDNHALFDMENGKPLNVRPNPTVEIGPHVWVASRATIIGDAHIGAGSTIAAGAIVKGNVPPCSVAAGVPARIVRQGVSWTRSENGEGWEKVRELLQQTPGVGD